jgi:HK97 family phage major capsid protein
MYHVRKEYAKMSALLNDLAEKRRKVWEDQKKILDEAGARPIEQRALTGEEQRKCDQMDGELSILDRRIADIGAGESRALQSMRTIDDIARQPVDHSASSGSAGGYKTAEQEAAELRSFFGPENRNGRLRPFFDIPLPNAIERRALGDSVQGAITTSAPLPTSFVGQLYRYLVDTSSIRQTNPTVYSTASGESLVVPLSTGEGHATWTPEGGLLSAADPVLSTISLGAYKVSKLIQVSSELLADTGFDIVGYLAESAGRNLGIAVDTAYVAGTGGNQPTGFLGAATVSVQATTGTGGVLGFPSTGGGDVGADVLIDLYYGVIPQYRPRASWVMHDHTIKAVRKLKDTTGQYIWQPALVAGQPDTILGRPVYADPNMPTFTAGSAEKVVAFGDFGGYFIRDVTPLRFERSDDWQFGNDMVSFRAIYRTDGKLADTNAVVLYESAAS